MAAAAAIACFRFKSARGGGAPPVIAQPLSGVRGILAPGGGLEAEPLAEVWRQSLQRNMLLPEGEARVATKFAHNNIAGHKTHLRSDSVSFAVLPTPSEVHESAMLGLRPKPYKGFHPLTPPKGRCPSGLPAKGIVQTSSLIPRPPKVVCADLEVSCRSCPRNRRCRPCRRLRRPGRSRLPARSDQSPAGPPRRTADTASPTERRTPSREPRCPP